MTAPITADLLSHEEAESFAKIGASLDAVGFDKSAQTLFGTMLDAGAKGIIYGSILTGIPVGIMAHMVHKKIKDKQLRERELDQQIEYYRNANSDIESGLANIVDGNSIQP
jgi:hypothetical protein